MVAVIGADGFIGRHLLDALRQAGAPAVGTTRRVPVREGLRFLDLARPDIEPLELPRHGCRTAVIAAGVSRVAACDTDPEGTRAANVRGTLELVRQLAAVGVRPVFLSSDYVFDGRQGGYDDDAPTQPTTTYGRQKQQVEEAIPGLARDFTIVRLSKTYGLQRGDGTLFDEMAALLHGDRPLRAAVDQHFCPTYVGDVVRILLDLVRRNVTGVLNLCSPEPASRCHLAASLARACGFPAERVTAVQLHDLPGMSDRPLDTTLRCSRLQALGFTRFLRTEAAIATTAANWRPDAPAHGALPCTS